MSLERVAVKLEVIGEPRTITVEPRTTLLDALREQLALTGTKKGQIRVEDDPPALCPIAADIC